MIFLFFDPQLQLFSAASPCHSVDYQFNLSILERHVQETQSWGTPIAFYALRFLVWSYWQMDPWPQAPVPLTRVAMAIAVVSARAEFEQGTISLVQRSESASRSGQAQWPRSLRRFRGSPDTAYD